MSDARIPPRLRRGDTIGVIAPAGPVRQIRLRKGLDALGDAFRVRLAPSLAAPVAPDAVLAGVRAADVPSYLAASDEVRAAELNAMLGDPDVRAIVLARGGYGLMRILPRLDAAALRRDPKPIVGFSDATAVLAWAHAAGVRGIHGPMIAQLADLAPSDTAHLVALLTDARAPGVRPWPLAIARTGAPAADRVEGALIAANLTLAATLVGTPWPVPLAGALALFEDVGERPYELDRYLTQLLLAGALAEARAIVVGDLARCEDANPPTGEKDPPDAALRTFRERAAAAGLPLASGAPIGHGTRNEAVPFGARAVLDMPRATLEILEPAVA